MSHDVFSELAFLFLVWHQGTEVTLFHAIWPCSGVMKSVAADILWRVDTGFAN